jgi:hypothetical protein
METQVVAKNMIMAVVNWGQKMAAHPKNVVWECFSCWPLFKSHLLASKNPL